MRNFKEISNMVTDSKKRAYQMVNREMILMYYQIGQIISEKSEDFVVGLSEFLRRNYSGSKSFDERNLNNMKQFYELYKDSKIVEKALVNLNWPMNLVLMSGCKSMEERMFYVDMCLEEELTEEDLKERIKEDYYKKYMESKKKVDSPFDEIRKIVDDVLDNETVLEYINKEALQTNHHIKESVLDDLKDFIIKNDKNISLFGEKYETDFDNLIDLLFLNNDLSCFVALDVEIGNNKKEQLKKMEDNLEYLDNYFNKTKECPSVGIIVCVEDGTIEYLFNRNLSPSMFVKYDSGLMNKELLLDKLKLYKKLL
ncbi:MAG: PDDEXK nuclease domain-containing protein [Erysipelotrichaceae bacterium]|nr:PDDEXK nuclease domain-containing protein [Solobacterium sp.]MDY3794396.1 PDDEXK nuclease domain-containing protein [Erysipelotrichaceae bacterium]MCI6846707.1 PDDEXK nuclease domain-containing protein [Solobacterium sp.]MCI6877391.1 PDDEXK nuclease domain-containing protein [Solobacterium sp.]MCI7445635.1 PDDEXK nuclease domain-containing protein [Solobacterium sp.]